MKKTITVLMAQCIMAVCMLAAAPSQISKTVRLNSGYDIPVLGLGTWTLTGTTCEESVYVALTAGYRLIDTARYYGNETAVGKAVARAIHNGICKRSDIFITTKIVPWSSSPESDIDDSLQKLGVEYIDLCLLHQHGSRKTDDNVYKAMIRGVKEGKIRSIGISNFYTKETVNHFVHDFEIPPSVIQNENHLKYQNKDLYRWAAQKGIYIESYYPFGGREHTAEHLHYSTVLQIASAHKKTAAQVIVRWHIQAGYIAIPGSSNPEHIAENYAVWDFSLSEKEMHILSELDTGKRYETW
ncbi:MAG: aldo/keto reductase [Treponema sp.]|nr:aldo/keto reductase [Treponema sp.]